LGLASDPAGGAHSAPPDPLARFLGGPTFKGREGRKKGGHGKGGRCKRGKQKGKEQKRKGYGGKRGRGPPIEISGYATDDADTTQLDR